PKPLISSCGNWIVYSPGNPDRTSPLQMGRRPSQPRKVRHPIGDGGIFVSGGSSAVRIQNEVGNGT
ncbi:MAG: hypothetical protein PF795_09085, partial [Kiritimatiellae bacterium]|nr:hypothetical protein [Kiritimatiellia bacterium]